MELNQYIEQTLVQVMEGVQNARDKSQYVIAPVEVEQKDKSFKLCNEPSFVEIEVMINYSKKNKDGVNKIIVVERITEKNEAQKVKFQVPVYFNGTKTPS